MKVRKVKKQLKKQVGYMAVNGCPVYNFVTNPEYTGGSAMPLDEDCYSIEVEYTRKKRGAPLLLTSRMSSVYEQVKRAMGWEI